MSKAIICIKKLHKSYKIYNAPIDRLKEAVHLFGKKYHKEFFALNDINFDICKGDTVGIVGKNGSGKSTLLKIITGVLTPTSGQVEINGKIAALLELGAGFNPEMTGLENIYLNGTLMGYTRKEVNSKVDNIIEFADIGDFIHQPVKTYSSGMFARLAFSVSVNVDPDILIVDEALSVGDVFFQQKCIHRMKNMQKNGTTIFFVSHSLSTVKSLCDKAIYLRNGELISIGDAESVCNLYQNELTDTSGKEKLAAESMVGVEDSNVKFIESKNSEKNYFREDEMLEKRITERSGGGEIVLTAFDIYDNEDQILSSVDMFQSFLIRAAFKVNKDVPDGACIGILCRDKMGIDIFACNSNVYSLYLSAMKEGETFVYEMELQLPLMPGQYFFHIGIKPNYLSSYFYDRCFTVGYIEMQYKKNEPLAGGMIFVEPKRVRVLKYE